MLTGNDAEKIVEIGIILRKIIPNSEQRIDWWNQTNFMLDGLTPMEFLAKKPENFKRMRTLLKMSEPK